MKTWCMLQILPCKVPEPILEIIWLVDDCWLIDRWRIDNQWPVTNLIAVFLCKMMDDLLKKNKFKIKALIDVWIYCIMFTVLEPILRNNLTDRRLLTDWLLTDRWPMTSDRSVRSFEMQNDIRSVLNKRNLK